MVHKNSKKVPYGLAKEFHMQREKPALPGEILVVLPHQNIWSGILMKGKRICIM